MRLLIIIAFIATAQLSFSQTYVPFISTADSSDQWFDFLQCGVDGGGSCLEYFRKVYSIDGDTIINGESYAKLSVVQEHAYEPGFFSPSPCPYSSSISSFFGGGIREANKLIFYFDPDSHTERIIYNFNLGIGDTVPNPIPIFSNPNERIIQSIDSVLVQGIYRKRYNLSEFNSPYSIIEGIGTTSGLLPNLEDNISCEYGLYCYLEHSISIFPNSNFPCSINLGLDLVQFDIQISPNPVDDYLTIKSNLETSFEIEILNGYGQSILVKSSSQSPHSVDVSDLASGIYFVKIHVNGKIGLQKLVIE